MDLAKENARLQQTIQKLLARIDDNQRIQQRFYDFEFELLACDSLRSFCDKVVHGSLEAFALDCASVVIHDPDYSIQALCDHLEIPSYNSRWQLRHNRDFFDDIYGPKPGVFLGELDVLMLTRLLPGAFSSGSVALLPLMRGGHILGSLNLSSSDPKRFTPDKAADFIVHLASVVGVCLENCIVREQLLWQGRLDQLTRVSNRRHFEQEMAKELQRSQRNASPLSCLFVDVDHFKTINDQYGHQAGDRCLKEVAVTIQQQLRKTDLVARYGGEEFVVLLPGSDRQRSLQVAERIRASIQALTFSDRGQNIINPTVSVGLADCDFAEIGAGDLSLMGEVLLSHADQAMYQAKIAGRNCVRWFGQA